MANKRLLEKLITATEEEFCDICNEYGWTKDQILFAFMDGVVTDKIGIEDFIKTVTTEKEYEIKHTKRLEG